MTYPTDYEIKNAQKMAIRIEALRAATKVFEGKGSFDSDSIISIAKRFERYLESGE